MTGETTRDTELESSIDREVVGLVSDVHANLPALEAVLEDMPEVDALLSAGDVVGYGPYPNECARILREEGAISVMGNHDYGLFGGRKYESGDEYADEVLTDENRSWIEEFPGSQTLLGGRVKMTHGHPGDGTKEFRYVEPRGFNEGLLGEEDLLVLGHTHKQAKKETDSGTIVNPGSVGQPRDRDPDAAYAVLRLPELEISLRRVSYDIGRVEEKVEETDIDRWNVTRLRDGR